jgi:trypsin
LPVRLFLVLVVVTPLLWVGTPWDRSQAIVNSNPLDVAPSWAVQIAEIGDDVRVCSAALIAPDLVISGSPGHCPRPATREVHAGVGRADLTRAEQGVQARVVRAFTHPSLDLAIYQLDTTILLPPVTIGSGQPGAGVPVTLYGYGRSTELTQAPVYDQKLRTAVGLVTRGCSQPSPLFCLVPQGIQGGCPGDSGGPLLASGALVGVYLGNLGNQEGVRCVGNSWYAVPVTDPGVRQWIDATIKAAA